MLTRSVFQAEQEMRQKVALIAKIRAIESVPVIRFKVSLRKLILTTAEIDFIVFIAYILCRHIYINEKRHFVLQYVDLTETSGAGLLNEMSIAEVHLFVRVYLKNTC